MADALADQTSRHTQWRFFVELLTSLPLYPGRVGLYPVIFTAKMPVGHPARCRMPHGDVLGPWARALVARSPGDAAQGRRPGPGPGD